MQVILVRNLIYLNFAKCHQTFYSHNLWSIDSGWALRRSRAPSLTVTACSDGVKKEKKWTSFESLFRLYMLSLIPKAIGSRHNVKSEVEIGRRVSDFWLSDDERRCFFPFVQTKMPGCRKKDHYHNKHHAKPWYCSFKTHRTRGLETVARWKIRLTFFSRRTYQVCRDLRRIYTYI